MDQSELLNAGGLGAIVAAVAALWQYRAAVWKWLPSFKSAKSADTSKADAVSKDYEALRYLESRSGDHPAGWAKGCAQIRKAFLPPLKESNGEG